MFFHQNFPQKSIFLLPKFKNFVLGQSHRVEDRHGRGSSPSPTEGIPRFGRHAPPPPLLETEPKQPPPPRLPVDYDRNVQGRVVLERPGFNNMRASVRRDWNGWLDDTMTRAEAAIASSENNSITNVRHLRRSPTEIISSAQNLRNISMSAATSDRDRPPPPKQAPPRTPQEVRDLERASYRLAGRPGTPSPATPSTRETQPKAAQGLQSSLPIGTN